MNNNMIFRVRQLREIGHNSREVAEMLGLSLGEVNQAASEPDEHTIVDLKTGETLQERVERKKRELWEKHLRELRKNDARIR